MPYCIADGFAQSLLCKVETAGSGTSTSIAFSYSTGNSGSKTYTTTQGYSKLYLILNWSINSPGESGGTGASIKISVAGSNVYSKSLSK